MKRFTALVLAAALLPCAALAQEDPPADDFACDWLGAAAFDLMQARQNGVALDMAAERVTGSVAENVVYARETRAMLRQLATIAYRAEREGDEAARQRAAERFRASVVTACRNSGQGGG